MPEPTPRAVVARPPVALPKRVGDERLTADELGLLSLFRSLKRIPVFQRYPGTTVLRRYRARETVIRQNDAGQTAFYILTDEDLLALRRFMLDALDRKLAEALLPENAKRKSRTFAVDQVELTRRRAAYRTELNDLERRAASAARSLAFVKPQPVAFARLQVDLNRDERRGPLRRFAERVLGKMAPAANLPRSIPIDGVSSIDPHTLTAPMYPGEVFGEMSCMNRAPRSATIIADRDCYMLEMQRNILDQLYRDPDYQVRMDEIYRRRVLEGDVRRLWIFRDLNDQEYTSLFKPLQTVRVEDPSAASPADAGDRLELIRFRTGTVIFDEGEDADCFYLVRSGVVQVSVDASCLIRAADVSEVQWRTLPGELRHREQPEAAIAHVWHKLQDELANAISDAPDGVAPNPMARAIILQKLNRFLQTATLQLELGDRKQKILSCIPSPELAAAIATFPDETEQWTGLEVQAFHRALLEYLFVKGLPRRAHQRRTPRVVAYCGRGESIGEMGVFLNLPRNATCVAYNHPRIGQELPGGPGAALPHVELVKIGKETFRRLVEMSPKIRERVAEIVSSRQLERERRAKRARTGIVTEQAPQEELGLLQGQNLMLIDLDRCTRCGLCVDACVNAHNDGHTRLYLDGPRFDKYLVPSTCRKCLDPVCMVGCPVGAINRGKDGEIQIANWCIGCDLCAKQCPYGAIQMNFRTNQVLFVQDELAPNVQVDPVEKKAVVCDLCSSLPSRDPACVYVCPHDAALRVNAQDFFLAADGSRG